MSDEAKEKIRKAQIGNHNGKLTKVCCIETGQVFESAAEAQRITGADASSIIKCLKGKLHKTHNLHWIASV